MWALTTAFCDHDREFARSYPRESVELNLKFLQEYAAPFQRGGEVPYDYQAYLRQQYVFFLLLSSTKSCLSE